MVSVKSHFNFFFFFILKWEKSHTFIFLSWFYFKYSVLFKVLKWHYFYPIQMSDVKVLRAVPNDFLCFAFPNETLFILRTVFTRGEVKSECCTSLKHSVRITYHE